VPPNPFGDAADFVTRGGFFGDVYVVLLVLAAAIALVAWWRNPAERGARAVGLLLLRVLTGTMWWQQSLWKIPPNYGGLIYWMRQEAAHAAIPLQGRLVREVVLPHIRIFGPAVYAIEVAIGVSLILGLYTRAGALLGILMGVNLWLGLYSAPREWPWTYFFLIIIMSLFAIDPPGRVLGLDALRGRGRGGAFLA
jgi:uncharacterized membrane protein YphA (DoxX/SURF4 family)